MHGSRPADNLSAMRSALAILHGEHVSCAVVLKKLVGHLDHARLHTFKPKLESFSTSLNFIATFLDQFHHPKEDEFLFLALRRHTTEADEVLRDLQFEHATSAQELDEMNTMLDRARSGGIEELHKYADMLKRYTHAYFAHVEREESLVIPIACRLLVEDDWQEIDRAFRANRDPLFGAEQNKNISGIFNPVANGVF